MSFFPPKASPISLIFLWVVGHLISVISCILDLTVSLREVGRCLATNSTFGGVLFLFLPSSPLKFSLSLSVLKKFHNFYSVPHQAYNS